MVSVLNITSTHVPKNRLLSFAKTLIRMENIIENSLMSSLIRRGYKVLVTTNTILFPGLWLAQSICFIKFPVLSQLFSGWSMLDRRHSHLENHRFHDKKYNYFHCFSNICKACIMVIHQNILNYFLFFFF